MNDETSALRQRMKLKKKVKNDLSYPLRHAIWSGSEQGDRLTSVSLNLVSSHLASSMWLSPTHFCSKLYPASSWIVRIFSFFGIWSSNASTRWIEILGFARSTSKIVWIFSVVPSDTSFDSKALPDLKSWLKLFPMVVVEVVVRVECVVVHQLLDNRNLQII